MEIREVRPDEYDAAGALTVEAYREFVPGDGSESWSGYLESLRDVAGRAQRSVVLVASDGEWLRFHLPDDTWLVKFAHKRGVPMYDAGVLGYPKRMKDYRRGDGT